MTAHDDLVYVRHIAGALENVSSAFRTLHGELPWSLMAQMRDRLIHHYWDVDVSVLWTTVTEDLPEITPIVSRLLP